MLRLPRDVERFGRGHLHSGAQLVAADAGVEAIVSLALGEMFAVQLGQGLDRAAVAFAGDEVAVAGGEKVGDRVRLAGIDDRPLMLRRQKGAVPVAAAVR